MPQAAKNSDAAKDFIAFFSTPKYEGAIATDAGNLTAIKDGPAPTNLESVQTLLNNVPTRTVFDGVSGEYFAKVFDPAFGDLWLGKSTPAQFLSTLEGTQAQFWETQP
ncbi:hypothetical protein [Microbacterium nymphoidis]|uniref:hypothetical protein n=1 Tax=Microbacterium nymphoidis TaxID=2898586 RepID=UPI001E5212D2|nr:hypothetical protein [Microbacterium nymphoidis]MCD2498471.1 hypothetical protein [Microbacterium nymphoidis]